MPLPTLTARLTLAGCLLAAAPLSSQTDTIAPPPRADTARAALPAPDAAAAASALVRPSGEPADRMRAAQLLGRRGGEGWLLRSTSTLAAPMPADGVRGIAPELRAVYNSALPFGGNDGALWAGHGWSAALTTGFRLRAGRVQVAVAPEIIVEQNGRYQTLRAQDTARSPFASPFHQPPGTSIDLPARFGTERTQRLTPGQSSLTVTAGPVALGWAADDQWWGPGQQSALVLSSNAAGVARLFARSAAPLRTRAGTLEWSWFVGTLGESDFFDHTAKDDTRSLSAAALTFAPAFEPELTVGVARAVYSAASGTSSALGHALDAFMPVGRAERPDSAASDGGTGGRDEVMSVFARWLAPESGVELYGEAARQRGPKSLRDLLLNPDHTLGYTVGFQWVSPGRGGASFRVAAEATNLEQSDTVRGRRTTPFYTSGRVPQGYTNGGQVLGAWTGPGSSSQWIAADRLGRVSRLGLVLGRVRWESESFVRFYPYHNPTAHDVTIYAGLRGGTTLGPVSVYAELVRSRRLNYLFQNDAHSLSDIEAVSINDNTLALTLSTPVRL